jgi:hypothetical protein
MATFAAAKAAARRSGVSAPDKERVIGEMLSIANLEIPPS